jgi:hypothetical protein
MTTQTDTLTPARGRIHFARLSASPRLQRLLAFLRERGEKGATTMEIITGASVVAVNSAVKELRMNGYRVECVMERGGKDAASNVYRYTLVEETSNTRIAA